jgi:Protein of unknown function (DUF3239)
MSEPRRFKPRSRASNPSWARVNHLRFARHYPKWPLIWTLSTVACAFLVFQASVWYAALLLPILACDLLYWLRIDNHFENGDANPGMIVQLNPTLVAVATDLTKGIGNFPAIKIVPTRLRRIDGQPLRPGMQLPTVAVYFSIANHNSARWLSFDPRPLECATADRNTLNRVMASFTREQKIHLEISVQSLPSLEPGLYRRFEQGWQKVVDFSPSDILIPPFLWLGMLGAKFFP